MNISSLVKRLAIRGIVIFVTVVIAIYITILIANYGGYIDEIVKSEIDSMIMDIVRNNPALRNLNETARMKYIEDLRMVMYKRYGLDKPFIYRSFIYLREALFLNLGRAWRLTSDSGSKQVSAIILERLPATILLFTTIQIIIFFSSLFAGLYLSRSYGSKLDKLIVALSPFSSMPGWFYGIFLIIIFASILRILPYGGMVDTPPPTDPLNYALSVLKHMILPMLSWLIAYLPISIYSMRTFFLIFSSEMYVDLAVAKGLPRSVVERRYILRPTINTIITQFSFTLISSWMGAMVTELVFNWPGMGLVTLMAINTMDPPVIIGITTVYAYLLGITIFILDVAYTILDPRVRLGVTGG